MEGTTNGIVHVYHGSKYEFDKFCFDNVGTEGGISGASYGLYFSESKSEALTYGENIYTCSLMLMNPLSNTSLTLDINKIQSMIKYLNDNEFYNYLDKFDGDINDKVDFDYHTYYLLDECKVDTDLVKILIDGGCDINSVMSMLKHFDYSHTIDKISPDDETITHYICYDCEAITIIKRQSFDDL